jgi:hypothetical protein
MTDKNKGPTEERVPRAPNAILINFQTYMHTNFTEMNTEGWGTTVLAPQNRG